MTTKYNQQAAIVPRPSKPFFSLYNLAQLGFFLFGIDRCPFAEKSFALGPAGTTKEPCMLGAKADCDRCGCVVPFYLKSLTDRRLILNDLATAFKTKGQTLFHKRGI